MPQVCKQGDLNSAGGSVVSGTVGSVTIEGLPVAVVGSRLTPDSLCSVSPGHCSPVIIQGSGSVTAGGIPIAFVGSSNSCGHVMISGAGTVIVGG